MTSTARTIARNATLACLLALATPVANAQETVLNVPSADVLDRGQTYMEWDITAGDTSLSTTVTPRSVNGIGHGIETGINISSFDEPTPGPVALIPTVKWKFFETAHHGLVLFAGDHVYLPIERRTYAIGNSTYLAAAVSFAATRISVGVYDFSSHTIDRANRAGVQASFEQTLTPRLSFATDWYSGATSVGQVTTGLAWKATQSLTLYPAYEMGNHDLMHGNHGFLFELGWNSAWRRPHVE